jgi:hypothetical protein
LSLKTAAVIFSFTLIILFSVGNYVFYSAYITSYKKEFKHYISTHKENTGVTTVTINPSDLYCNSARITWEDDNKEIVHEGVLYDIVSIGSGGLTVELTVVSDKQEMELKNQFASIYDVSSGKATKNPLHLLKAFLALKFVPAADNMELNNPGEHYAFRYPHRSFLVVNKIISIETPPPDLSL